MWSKLLAVLKSQIGYTESPAGSNNTKYGKWFGMNGSAWCAIFVCWAANMIGILARIGGKRAYTPDMAQWFYNRKQWYQGKAPKAGYIAFFNFGDPNYGGRWKGIHHVGYVIGVLKDGRIVTIEGNTSSGSSGSQSNGGGVFQRYRDPSLIAGYGTPKYDPESAPAPKPPTGTPAPAPTWPRKAVMLRNSQLWNTTHGTKRTPSPAKGGVVSVSKVTTDSKGVKWASISWGGHSGDVLYKDIKYV